MKKQQKHRKSSIDSSASLDSKDSMEFDQMAGELLFNRYIIVKFISYGTFSNVYLAYDTKNYTFVVIKIQNTKYYKDAIEELHYMKKLCTSGHSSVVQLLDSFTIELDSDKHFCFVLELLGPDLFSVLNDYECLDLPQCKKIVSQLLKAMQFINEKGVIHTDLKPENIMFCETTKEIKDICNWFNTTFNPSVQLDKLRNTLPDDFSSRSLNAQRKYRKNIRLKAPKRFCESIKSDLVEYIFSREFESESDYIISEECSIKLVDFGLCVPIDSNPDDVQSRHYRAPEMITLDPADEKIDIWSVGCIVYEILTGETLFDPKYSGDDHKSDICHLVEMYRMIGKMPLDLSLECEFSEDFFDSRGRIKGHKKIDYLDLSDELFNNSELSESESESCAKFIKTCCDYNPKTRPSASQLLQLDWFN